MPFPVDAEDSAKKLRILFVINSPVVGGAERHTFDLSANLNRIGFDSCVFAMKQGPIKTFAGGELFQPQQDAGLVRRIADLAEFLRTRPCDLVVGVNERPIVAAYFARRSLKGVKPKIIGVSHSTILRNLREKLLQIPHIIVCSLIDGMIFISRNQQKLWRRRGLRARRESLILNGIDVDRYSPAARTEFREATRAEFGFGPADYVIGHCAVFRPEKNHLLLLEALARLRGQGVAAKALLIGDGPMRAALEARCAELGLTDYVAMPGMRQDVRPLLAAIDIGVNCSTSIETMSLAALEMMAMGTPMVMSDLGGASEIISAETGQIFPVGDCAALVAALRSYTDAAKRQQAGLAARNRIEALFDHRVMVRHYADSFREMAQSPV